jgi:hypothetical protein
LNGHALSIKRGRKLRFLREICPLKKMTPKSCPVNGTVTGKLLTMSIFHNSFQIHTIYLLEEIHVELQNVDK